MSRVLAAAAAAHLLAARVRAAAATVAVTSVDGLTTIAVDVATGDLASASAPGAAPLVLGPGSGSFIGAAAAGGAAARAAVYPNAVIATCNTSEPLQQFAMPASGRVLSADATHCLDAWNCGTANGTVVSLYPCDSGATCGDPARTLNELWAFDAATGALSSLLGAPNELCVDVFGGAGPAVDLWACTGGANQQWAYDAATRLLASVGNPGMCLSAPPPPPPPPPPPCEWVGGAAAVSGGGGAPIVVARNASCLGGAAVVLVTDTYAAAATSVAWTSRFEVTSATGAALPAFTVPLGASLRPVAAGADPLALWTTWTRGCVDNGPGMCFGDGPWREPFSPLALPTSAPTLFRLGNRDYGAVFAPFGDRVDDSITVPLASLLRAGDDFGLTLLLSPEEPLLELLLRADGSAIDFARLLRRLGPAATTAPVVATMHLRAHAADWRPAMQLLLDVHPQLVLPHSANASRFDGLGGYSWQAPVNQTYADAVGFAVNWELSGTFMPYDGLFAPYQPEWQNLGPINAGLPQYNVTYARISGFDASVQAAGLNSLTYFDVGNWGVSIDTSRAYANVTCGVRPGGGAAPCPTPEGANAFLQHYLSDALLDSAWRACCGVSRGAIGDWVGTTLMDPSEPFFEDLLLEQLERRMGALVPTAQGIAIDRFDYTAYYSYKRDDGVSWVPQAAGGWGPAQSLVQSHVHTYARIAAALRAAGPTKLMLGNCNTLCRIDVMGLFDGGFSEGAALNAVAWTGLRRPTILWTYSLDAHSQADLDTFFQQHVLMRVFPMAPLPENDHSIQPGSPVVQQAYFDYAPLFLALRGCEWVLDVAHPINATSGGGAGGSCGGGACVNVFRATLAPVPGTLLGVVALAGGGGGASTAAVTVAGAVLGAAAAFDAFGLVPGSGDWAPIGRLPVGAGGALTVPALPMLRGCALLRLVPA